MRDNLAFNLITPRDVLLKITEKIKQACDSGKYTCGVFLGLQKASDTVNHDILLKKLNHYRIRGITNNWFC